MQYGRPSVLTLVLAVACTGEPSAPEVTTPPPPVSDAPPTLSAAELASGSENIALVPSVVETQSALTAAGIDAKLADLIAHREFDVKNANKDNVAVRTGVVVADMLLTVKTAEKDQLLANLAKIKEGMVTLDGGADIQTVVTEMEEGVKGDSLTRDQLLKELDELSGAVIPELKFNGQTRIVPLIQAGSWVEGANLVSKAVKQAGKPEAADSLLKQPAVVDYFIQYVKTEGQAQAPEAVTLKLEESLGVLKALAEKKEPFTAEDLDKVVAATDDVLKLL